MTDSPELEQARYWYDVVRANCHRGTMQGFCESVDELDPTDNSPEVRLYRRERRFFGSLIRQHEREEQQAGRRALRRGMRAPVWDFSRGLPVVHGRYGRCAVVWYCPHCGERHASAYNGVNLEVICDCEHDATARCLVIIIPIRPLIRAYIPGRSP